MSQGVPESHDGCCCYCCSVQVNNLTLMELNAVRPFLTGALNHLSFLQYHATQHTGGSMSATL